MLIPEKMREVLKKEGPVAIATSGDAGPHLVNSWNTYVRITDNERLLMPVGRMNQTEANIKKNSNVLLTVGTREVAGFHGPGTGFLIKGKAEVLTAGPEFDATKAVFGWARAVLVVTIATATQTL